MRIASEQEARVGPRRSCRHAGAPGCSSRAVMGSGETVTATCSSVPREPALSPLLASPAGPTTAPAAPSPPRSPPCSPAAAPFPRRWDRPESSCSHLITACLWPSATGSRLLHPSAVTLDPIPYTLSPNTETRHGQVHLRNRRRRILGRQGHHHRVLGTAAQGPRPQGHHSEDGPLPQRGRGHHEPLPTRGGVRHR